LFFVIPGFVFTSVIFKEISSFANGWSYFILPANRIEKMVAYWLLTTVVYIIFSLSILIISSLIISGLVSLLFEPTFFVFNPLNFQFQELIVHYLVLQSVYFLGAISFQRNHFFITTLFVLLVLGFLVLFSILGFRLIFGDWSIFLNADTVSPEFFEQIKLWIKVIYYGLLAPFFLLMSYLRFKEKEI
ncbi:MAG TPA: hypothetical protein PK990_11090, partial [Salinivirgaceae bacterium]|nr:hypothetical protein [Salinivirgaceae bacterium]